MVAYRLYVILNSVLVARGFIARRRFKKLLAVARREAGLIADFLEYLPRGAVKASDRVGKLVKADKARPKGSGCNSRQLHVWVLVIIRSLGL